MSEAVDAPHSAAFVDVDNTLLRGASMYFLARGLARRKLVNWRQIVKAAWKQWKYLASGKEHVKDLRRVTDSTMAFVAGRNVAEMQDVVRSVVDEILLNKLWPGTLKIAQAHLARGQEVWLVTAAPNDLARLLAERLGFTGGVGTCAQVVEGRFTGHLDGAPMHGRAKADKVREIARDRGLDLASCTAYSDSANDVPMLTVVGNAVAVNPDAALRRYARKRDWLIVEYRRSRLLHGGRLPANPNVAVGYGIAAGLAAAAREKGRREQ